MIYLDGDFSNRYRHRRLASFDFYLLFAYGNTPARFRLEKGKNLRASTERFK